MKSTLILAASALLGSANAGVHRMKLEKVPLENQLVSSFEDVPMNR
jgi:saccharopepsin